MTNRHSIHNDKLFCFVVAVVAAISLLAEHGQSSPTMATAAKKEQNNYLKEAVLIEHNFAVQREILTVYKDCAARFRDMFGTIRETEIKKAEGLFAIALRKYAKPFTRALSNTIEGVQYLRNWRPLLEIALKNLRLDANAAFKHIHADQKLFGSVSLIKLKEWLDSAHNFNSGHVKPVMQELKPILMEMTSSKKRQEWRDKAKKIIVDHHEKNSAALKELKDLRVAYDSVYVLLAIVHDTFEAAMIASSITAGPTVAKMQTVAEKLAETAKNLHRLVEGEHKVLDRLESALKPNKEGGGKKLTLAELDKVYSSNIIELRFQGEYTDDVAERLTNGDPKAFAELMGKPEDYVPGKTAVVSEKKADESGGMDKVPVEKVHAEAGQTLDEVMKYQVMQDAAKLRVLKYDVLVMDV